MRRKSIPRLILFLFLFSLFLPGLSLSSPKPASHPLTLAVLSQKIQSSIKQISPFLSGAFSKDTFDRAFDTLSRIPLPATFSGKGIRAEELLSSLFPKNYEKFPLKGILNFTFKARETNHGGISITVNLTLQNPQSDSPFCQAKKLNIFYDITLFPQSRKAMGNLGCEISSFSIKIANPSVQITASKVKLNWVLHNRHYTFKANLEQLACPSLMLGRETLQDIQIGALSLFPRSLNLHFLSFLLRGSKLELNRLRLDLSSLDIETTGTIKADLPTVIQGPPHIKGIQGNIHYTLQGTLNPPNPTLSGKFEARKIKVRTTEGSINLRSFKTCAKLIGKRLIAPDLRFTVKNVLLFRGSASLDNISAPFENLQATFDLSVKDVSKLRSVMEVLAPSLPLPTQYSGRLRLKADVKTGEKKTAFQGFIHFDGDIHDAPLPMTVKGISLSIPFDVEMTNGNKYPPQPIKSQKSQGGFIRIQTIGFGIVAINDLKCILISTRNRITVDDITFDLFQGHASGKGYLGLLPPYPWKIMMEINNVSLKDVCDHIPGFQDALSGRVTTALTLMGNKGKLSSMRGDFIAKTVKSKEEPRRISQEFIRRLTGKKGRFFFLQKYRPYNKGIIEAKIEKGIIIFKALELSHKFLGFKDLSIAVSQLSNKISIKDLIWEILQVSKTNVGQPVIKTK